MPAAERNTYPRHAQVIVTAIVFFKRFYLK
jgi:hypothetical protein